MLLPGDPERRSAARRRRGIPIDETSWNEIRDAALKVGVTEEEIGRALETDGRRTPFHARALTRASPPYLAAIIRAVVGSGARDGWPSGLRQRS